MVRTYAITAMVVALAPFQWSAKPLSQPVKTQLKERGFWHKGCPVPLSGLRLLTVTHQGFDRRAHTGQLIVHRRQQVAAVEGFFRQGDHQELVGRARREALKRRQRE